MQDETVADQKHRKYTFKKNLITGLIFIIPMGVTYWILAILLQKMHALARPLIDGVLSLVYNGNAPHVPGWILTFVSLLLVTSFILLVGWLASFYMGKKLLSLVEMLIMRVPVVRGIYGGTKQIIEAFSPQRAATAFKRVCLLEYPRKDCWVLGFITNDQVSINQSLFGGEPVAGVFVPSTPNPTTGFLLYLPPEELHIVDLTVEEAVKLIVSAGLVTPNSPRKNPVTLAMDLEAKKAEAKLKKAASQVEEAE